MILKELLQITQDKGGLIVNKFVLIFILFLYNNIVKGSCNYINIDSIENRTFIYDTIEGLFYYERGIFAYLDVYKTPNGSYNEGVFRQGTSFLFVKDTNHIDSAYYNGFFWIVFNKYDFNINRQAIDTLDANVNLYYYGMHTPLKEALVNPFCNSYYDKYYLKIVVVYIGEQEQRAPHFKTCEELKELNYDKHYQMITVPIYVITDVLEFKEMW